MISFVIYKPDGTISRYGSVSTAEDLAIQTLAPGESILSGVEGRPGAHTVVGGNLVPVAPVTETLAQARLRLQRRLAERRWNIEVAGVMVGGVTFATDDRTKILLAAAAKKAAVDPDEEVRWKVAPGVWVPITSATILAAEAAVYDHVRVCFAREAELTDVINAATEITPALVQAVEDFWEQP